MKEETLQLIYIYKGSQETIISNYIQQSGYRRNGYVLRNKQTTKNKRWRTRKSEQNNW